MTRCTLCNDLAVGEGDLLPWQTWITNILNSPCHYCQVVVRSVKELEPDLFSRGPQSIEQDAADVAELNLEVRRQGHIYINLDYDGGSCDEVRIELFRTMQDDLQSDSRNLLEVPVRGEISPLPGDPLMWTFLRSSLRQCLEEHTACRESQTHDWWPKRLLLIREHDSKCTIQLIDTRDHHPASGYVALSHCWGPEQLISTTSDNLEVHLNGINYTSLPRTFQDAITVASKMSVTYLWIDSLCIIQGDKDDWARHTENMGKIYENAMFVVAATSSSAGCVPFLGPDATTSRYRYRTVDIESDSHVDTQGHRSVGFTTKARMLEPQLLPEWIRGPLTKRAWAYQESYCAVRLISFTDTEAKWYCKIATGCECHGALTQEVTEQLDMSDDKAVVFDQWRQVCSEYAERDLTYKTDRLPALAGIASRFHGRVGSTYLAGLWQAELPFNLSWWRRDLTDGPAYAPLVAPDVANGVPTWSWASIKRMSWWLWDFYFVEEASGIERQSLVDIVQIDCVPSAANAFGEVRVGSFIELRGRVVQVVMESDDFGRASVSRAGFNAQVVYMDCRTTPTTDFGSEEQCRHMRRDAASAKIDDSGDAGTRPSTRYRGTAYCLLLYSATVNDDTQVCVLVLGETKIADKRCYQRLGIGCGSLQNWHGPPYDQRRDWALWQGWADLEQWTDWKAWFADADTRTLRIV